MQTTAKLPASVYLLFFAQTINLTMAVLSVSVGALAGLKLAPSAALGTVPYGLQFLAVMLFTYLASFLMRKKGRAFVFHLASVFLLVSGLLGYQALQLQRFEVMCLSHFFLGLYIACANFYRFAATDGLEPAIQPKAISLVVLGGVLAAFVGPFLATRLSSPIAEYVEFSRCYAAMAGFSVFNSALVYCWSRLARTTDMRARSGESLSAVSYPKLPILSAVITGSFGYLVMNLLMILSSILMQGICSFSDSSQAIRWHVLSMFLPSFFTGALINRLGIWCVIHTGFLLLFLACLMGALLDSTYDRVVLELIVLGVGWNLSYVGGSALLASNAPPRIQHTLQGVNDSAVALCATVGAFLPSVVFSHMGWALTHWLSAGVCASVLLLNVLINKKIKGM